MQTEATRRACGRPLPHPIDQHRVLGRRLGPLAAGDEQGIQRLAALRERTCGKRHAGRGRNAFAALRHDPEQVGPRAARAGDDIVGGGEHLNRPGDIEQLHRRDR